MRKMPTLVRNAPECKCVNLGEVCLISWNSLAVVAGTSLKGNIRLHVKRKLDPTKLILHFCGKETSIISRTTKSSL